MLIKKLNLLLLLLVCTSVSFAQSGFTENIKDEYLKTFNPESYHSYKAGEGILKQGEALANNLSRNLANYQDLVNTTDPDELLADFNHKMQNIENLEEQFLEANRNLGYQVGQNLGNSISSGDAEATMFQALGALSSLGESRRARKELEAKKQALQKQRRDKMSEIYWKAVEYNEKTKKQYLELAAYAETPEDEQYYLAYVENLECYAGSMESNWSSYHTRWLQNNCPAPPKSDKTYIENTFIPKDAQYSSLAKKKYRYYLNTEIAEFRSSAISFAAAAAKINPEAKYYYQIGEYYQDVSTILALSSFLTARELNPGFFDPEKERSLTELRNNTELEINRAIVENDKEYLTAFLDSELDKTIRVDGKSILNYAVRLDQPDAVQLILNKYVEDQTQDEINEKLQKTIMMCAVHNSTQTLQRFIDLSVNVNFTLQDHSPIDIAEKVRASEAFSLLLDHSDQKGHYSAKYANSPTLILAMARSNPAGAAESLGRLYGNSGFEEMVSYMMENLDDHPEYIGILGSSKEASNFIQADRGLKQQILYKFKDQVLTEYPASTAHLYLKHDLVNFDHIPLLSELEPEKETGQEIVSETGPDEPGTEQFNIGFKTEILIERWKEQLKETEQSDLFTGKQKKDFVDAYKKLLTDLQEIQSKATTGTVSEEEERKIDMYFIGHLMGDIKNDFEHLRKPFHDYLLNKYMVVEHISSKEKLKVIIEDLEKQGQAKETVQYWKDLLKKGLSASEENTVNYLYLQYALKLALPLDNQSLNRLLENPYNTGNNTPDNMDQQSLAHIAYEKNNPQLFRELDKKFNLAEVTDAAGRSLFETMLTSDYFSNLVFLEQPNEQFDSDRLAYYSTDFNFDEKLQGLHPVYTYLINKSSLQTHHFTELAEIYHAYDIDPNSRITPDGGTILHFLATQIREYSYIANLETPKFIAKMGLDKKIKNNEGQTAYDVFNKQDNSRSFRRGNRDIFR